MSQVVLKEGTAWEMISRHGWTDRAYPETFDQDRSKFAHFRHNLQKKFPPHLSKIEPSSLPLGLRDWLSTHSCMPLQQLPTVTKDANAHARLGYVRSQSLASTTTSLVETRGRLGKLLPTSALKNVGKTKSTPLAKIPADEHIFSPPDDAHRCSHGSDAEWTPKADRANFRSSSTRPHSYRSPDKCHECVKKGQLHWGEPLRLAISWSSWWCYWCYWAHRRQWERKDRSLFRTSRWEQSPPRRGRGVYRRDLLFSDSLCRARKTWIDDWTLALGNVKEAILFANRQVSFRKVTQPGVGVERLLVFLPGRRAANTWTALLLYVLLLSEYITAGYGRKQQELVSVCAKRSLKPPSAWGEWVKNLSGNFF